jgi:hypothetical protein
MTGFEAGVLFFLAAALAVFDIARSLRRILQGTRAIRTRLDACPERLELRYRIVETVSTWNDGTVVPFPLKQRQPRPEPGLRAAA